MTPVVLEGLDLAMPDDAVAAALTIWASVSFRPVGLFHCCPTLGLSTIVLQKLAQSETWLELKVVCCHDSLLIERWNHHGNLPFHLRQNLSHAHG